MAGISLPEDRVIDGVDIMPILTGAGHTLHDHFFFITKDKVLAARKIRALKDLIGVGKNSYLFRL